MDLKSGEFICGCASFYLTDIPRHGEEYEVIYGARGTPSWGAISVLLHDKLTLLFYHIIRQAVLPNSDPTRCGLSGRSLIRLGPSLGK